MNRIARSPVLFAIIGLWMLSGTAAAQDDITRSFNVSPGGSLILDVHARGVQIVTENVKTVKVVAEDVPDRYKNDLRIEQKGNNVHVVYRPGRSRNIDTRFFITIPVEFNVETEYGGGRFELGETLQGELKLKTGGGNVDIGTVTGTTGITSGGGSIEARRLGGNASVTTGGGNVTVREVGSDATLKTGGGNVKLENVGGNLVLTTGGGNMRVEKVGGEAEVESGGGNVKIGPVTKASRIKTGGGNLEVLGATGDSRVKSGGGNITLEKMTGSVDVRTGGGNVTTELTPSNQPSSIHSGGGEITLSVPADAKVTIEATLNHHRARPGRYKIRTDYPAESVSNDDDRSYALIKLNGGGPTITLETTDGDINIRKLR